ncbi:hypothetical protein WJX77_009719 [Trebouxia sp. C0004]
MADADKGKQVLGIPASQGTGAGLGPLTPAAKLSVAAGSKRSSTLLSKSFNKRPATKVAAPTGAQPYLTGRVISCKVVISKNHSRSNSLEFVSRADGRVHHTHTSPPKDAVSVVKRDGCYAFYGLELSKKSADNVYTAAKGTVELVPQSTFRAVLVDNFDAEPVVRGYQRERVAAALSGPYGIEAGSGLGVPITIHGKFEPMTLIIKAICKTQGCGYDASVRHGDSYSCSKCKKPCEVDLEVLGTIYRRDGGDMDAYVRGSEWVHGLFRIDANTDPKEAHTLLMTTVVRGVFTVEDSEVISYDEEPDLDDLGMPLAQIEEIVDAGGLLVPSIASLEEVNAEIIG